MYTDAVYKRGSVVLSPKLIKLNSIKIVSVEMGFTRESTKQTRKDLRVAHNDQDDNETGELKSGYQ
jgi:hypothetical protein